MIKYKIKKDHVKFFIIDQNVHTVPKNDKNILQNIHIYYLQKYIQKIYTRNIYKNIYSKKTGPL